MTNSCTNPDDLHELASKVEEIITTLKGKLPKSEGLILRPEARKRARQRAKKICRKYLNQLKEDDTEMIGDTRIVLEGKPMNCERCHMESVINYKDVNHLNICHLLLQVIIITVSKYQTSQ